MDAESDRLEGGAAKIATSAEKQLTGAAGFRARRARW